MSFGDEGGAQFKKFVSQDEIDEQRRKRQEEWEKVRQPDQPLEAPEEEHDPRSLFEQLQDQKNKAQDEYEEKVRLSSQVKGLEEEEADFLNYVSEKQEEITKKREQENEELLHEYREAMVNKVVDRTKEPSEERKPLKPQVGASQSKKSQTALLAGAIKRKGAEKDEEDVKRRKSSETVQGNPSSSSTESSRLLPFNGEHNRQTAVSREIPGQTASSAAVPGQTAQVAAILPGIGSYSDSESELSSDSSDVNTDIFPKQKICVHSGGCGGNH